MRRGEQTALKAMKKEHARLSKAAAKAKEECDLLMNCGTRMIDIHMEFIEVTNSNDSTKQKLAKVEKLQKEQEHLRAISKKDLITLSNREINLAIERDALSEEIQMMEFRNSLR